MFLSEARRDYFIGARERALDGNERRNKKLVYRSVMANQARGMPSQVIALWVRERHGPKMLFGKLLSKAQGLWGKGLKSGKTFKSSQHELPYIGLVL